MYVAEYLCTLRANSDAVMVARLEIGVPSLQSLGQHVGTARSLSFAFGGQEKYLEDESCQHWVMNGR